jgi:hypothetical protein
MFIFVGTFVGTGGGVGMFPVGFCGRGIVFSYNSCFTIKYIGKETIIIF